MKHNIPYVGWRIAQPLSCASHPPPSARRLPAQGPREHELRAVWPKARRLGFDAPAARDGSAEYHHRYFGEHYSAAKLPSERYISVGNRQRNTSYWDLPQVERQRENNDRSRRLLRFVGERPRSGKVKVGWERTLALRRTGSGALSSLRQEVNRLKERGEKGRTGKKQKPPEKHRREH